MAKITVMGTATRLFYNDMGVEVSESYKDRNGQTLTRKYTAWFSKPVDFREGATGEFTGNLSAKVDEYVSKLDGSTKHAIALKINDAEFTATNLGFAPVANKPQIAEPAADLMPF